MSEYEDAVLEAIEFGEARGLGPSYRDALERLVAQRDGSAFLKNCAEAALLIEERRRVAADAEVVELRKLLAGRESAPSEA